MEPRPAPTPPAREPTNELSFTFPRERVGAVLGALGLIMVIVTIRMCIGTPGPAFWCGIAAITLLVLGATLAYTPTPAVETAPAPAASVTGLPDYVEQGPPPDASVTRRPPSPFAGGD